MTFTQRPLEEHDAEIICTFPQSAEERGIVVCFEDLNQAPNTEFGLEGGFETASTYPGYLACTAKGSNRPISMPGFLPSRCFT